MGTEQLNVGDAGVKKNLQAGAFNIPGGKRPLNKLIGKRLPEPPLIIISKIPEKEEQEQTTLLSSKSPRVHSSGNLTKYEKELDQGDDFDESVSSDSKRPANIQLVITSPSSPPIPTSFEILGAEDKKVSTPLIALPQLKKKYFNNTDFIIAQINTALKINDLESFIYWINSLALADRTIAQALLISFFTQAINKNKYEIAVLIVTLWDDDTIKKHATAHFSHLLSAAVKLNKYEAVSLLLRNGAGAVTEEKVNVSHHHNGIKILTAPLSAPGPNAELFQPTIRELAEVNTVTLRANAARKNSTELKVELTVELSKLSSIEEQLKASSITQKNKEALEKEKDNLQENIAQKYPAPHAAIQAERISALLALHHYIQERAKESGREITLENGTYHFAEQKKGAAQQEKTQPQYHCPARFFKKIDFTSFFFAHVVVPLLGKAPEFFSADDKIEAANALLQTIDHDTAIDEKHIAALCQGRLGTVAEKVVKAFQGNAEIRNLEAERNKAILPAPAENPSAIPSILKRVAV